MAVNQGGQKMPDINIDWNKLLELRPDVKAQFENDATRDYKSKQQLLNLGILTDTDYAKYWYNNMGSKQGFVAPNKTVVDYFPPDKSQPTTLPPTPVETTTGGVGSGATTLPGGNRDTALKQAQLRARLLLQQEGISDPSFSSQIDNYLTDIYNTISPDDKNAGSYFDPNLAMSFIGGRNNQFRNSAKSSVNSLLKKPALNYTSLDATISKLLGEAGKEGEEYLQRGVKRGQFNDTGYNAGLSKLEQAKTKARSKLSTYAGDLINKYSGQFNDIYSRASQAANNADAGVGFDITPFQQEYDTLSSRVNGSNLEGELLGVLGEQPLIDFASLRGSVGKAQGAVNLRDLDVLDGIAKRKRASDFGRGLGSEGAF